MICLNLSFFIKNDNFFNLIPLSDFVDYLHTFNNFTETGMVAV